MDARLRLYREGLDLLHPEQVLYMDMVSLIYKWCPGLPELPTGPFLGKLKKELDDEDAIVQFATAGPKTYGFHTHLGTLECKVRGFTLNIRGQQQLNLNLLKQNVLEEIQRPQDQPVNSLLVNLSSRLLKIAYHYCYYYLFTHSFICIHNLLTLFFFNLDCTQ